MGVAPYFAKAIMREHKYRPFSGDALLFGRQCMLFTPEHALAMIREKGIEPKAITLDATAVDRSTHEGRGHSYIRDETFFRLLGVDRVRALDHSAYEDAEIVHDLNVPIPDELEGSADIILDGSTLDNLFSPSVALQNVARMLRVGGRFFSINVGGAHLSPYSLLTPYWLLDFFALNEFVDARVYVTLHGLGGEINVFKTNPADRVGPPFITPRQISIVAFAEKGLGTTWNRLPVQRYYCSEAMMAIYLASAERFDRSARPELLVSDRPLPLRFSLLDGAVEHYRMMRSLANYPVVGADGKLGKIRMPNRVMALGSLFRRFSRVS